MFEEANAPAQRNSLTDWVLRGSIALAFLLFGRDKFNSAPGSQWVTFFAQVGLGQWFRIFTGVVEVLGAVLVLIPWTVSAGLALLACTMAGAVLVHIFVMHHPFNGVIPLIFLIGLVVFARNRRMEGAPAANSGE